MPFGMGWLVDVRDLIMKNPLWMFLIFLCIVKYRLTIERKLKGPEAENYEEQYYEKQNDDSYSSNYESEEFKKIYAEFQAQEAAIEKEIEDEFGPCDDEKPKWYKKLFKKMKRMI